MRIHDTPFGRIRAACIAGNAGPSLGDFGYADSG